MIKKVFITISVVFLTCTMFSSVTHGHPGRTDSQGGHTCWTNCEQWGLEYGEYHFGNSENSSSSSTTSESTTESSTPIQTEPAYSQADVDEGKSFGKSQGYEEGYGREGKNPQTDSGNEGYQKGYTEGYEAGYAEGIKKIKEEDIAAGTTSGEVTGAEDYKDGGDKDISFKDAESEEWNTAYQAAYISAYDREQLIDESEKLGNELGYSLSELIIPTNIAGDETLEDAFELGYTNGYEKRMNEEKATYIEIGEKNGLALLTVETESIDKRFTDFYTEGYEKGMSKRKKEVLEEGYQSSFIHMEYKEKDFDNNQQVTDWYKEGFDSNDLAAQIKEVAFENGHMHSEYYVPEEFKVSDQSIELYDDLFQQGQELRAKENKQKMMYIFGIGLPLAGIAAIGLWLFRKRRINKAAFR